MATATVPVGRPSRAGAAVPLLVGAVVALGIGVYGKVHDPTGESIFSLVFTKTINMKAWFVTAAVVLALFQLFTALWMYGRLSFLGAQPAGLGVVHRVSGSLAFLLTVPVAYHCLWALGFQTYTTRVFVHSVAGCLFYGAFAAKVTVVQSKRLPGWWLPVAGGALFTAIVVVWFSSAYWFFTTVGFPQF